MTYDEELADRIRFVVEGEPGLSEKKMFGGLGFLINGNLAVSASGQGGLMVRVDPSAFESLLAEPGVEHFEMRDRRMNGWLHVDVSAVEGERDLRRWVNLGVAFAGSLPPK
jgi:TfoX/Sxy family transcriptional regulator of competence genes